MKKEKSKEKRKKKQKRKKDYYDDDDRRVVPIFAFISEWEEKGSIYIYEKEKAWVILHMQYLIHKQVYLILLFLFTNLQSSWEYAKETYDYDDDKYIGHARPFLLTWGTYLLPPPPSPPLPSPPFPSQTQPLYLTQLTCFPKKGTPNELSSRRACLSFVAVVQTAMSIPGIILGG